MSMMKEAAALADRLARARDAGTEAKTELDNLNEALLTLQKKFVALNLGVTAFVPLEQDEDDERHDVTQSLGFERHGTEWMFTVTWHHPTNTTQTTPLLKASKARRMECAYRVGDLLEALILRTENEADEVRKAIKEVNAVGGKLDAAMRGMERYVVRERKPMELNDAASGLAEVDWQSDDQKALDDIVKSLGPDPKGSEVAAAMRASSYFAGKDFKLVKRGVGQFELRELKGIST